jgi:hypothetical protein
MPGAPFLILVWPAAHVRRALEQEYSTTHDPLAVLVRDQAPLRSSFGYRAQ